MIEVNAAAMAEVLEAVRADTPDVMVGVSTGAWVLPNPQARVQAIREWTILPDFASVNWHETGAEDVAAALLQRGVGVEAGLWHAEAMTAWLESPHHDRCLRVLLELPDGLDEAASTAMADRLLDLLGPGPGLPVSCCTARAAPVGPPCATPPGSDCPPGSALKTPSRCPTDRVHRTTPHSWKRRLPSSPRSDHERPGLTNLTSHWKRLIVPQCGPQPRRPCARLLTSDAAGF